VLVTPSVMVQYAGVGKTNVGDMSMNLQPRKVIGGVTLKNQVECLVDERDFNPVKKTMNVL